MKLLPVFDKIDKKEVSVPDIKELVAQATQIEKEESSPVSNIIKQITERITTLFLNFSVVHLRLLKIEKRMENLEKENEKLRNMILFQDAEVETMLEHLDKLMVRDAKHFSLAGMKDAEYNQATVAFVSKILSQQEQLLDVKLEKISSLIKKEGEPKNHPNLL